MKFDEIYFNNKKKYIYYIYKNIYTIYTLYISLYIYYISYSIYIYIYIYIYTIYIVNSNLQAYALFVYLNRQIKLTFGTIAQKKQKRSEKNFTGSLQSNKHLLISYISSLPQKEIFYDSMEWGMTREIFYYYMIISLG